MAAKRQLIIIPGLGDREWLYRFIKPLWTLYGFKVHIFVFGWREEHAALEKAQNRLDAFVNDLGERPYIVGASAGGTAAVNILAARPESVAKVVTVCTPYKPVPHLTNGLFAKSIKQTARNFVRMNSSTRDKILSLHGLYDQVVPVAYSRLEGPHSKRMLTIGHGPSILAALTLHSRVIQTFFR